MNKYHVYATNQLTQDGDLEIRVMEANTPHEVAKKYLELYQQDLNRLHPGRIVVLKHEFIGISNTYPEMTVFFIKPVTTWSLEPGVK
jgi:hypothetical protein